MNIDSLTLGHVVLDDIIYPDGVRVDGRLGGAGAYAVIGQALAAGTPGIVSGVGEDFPDVSKGLFASSGVDTAGLVSLDPKTPRTLVQYYKEDDRLETSQHGDTHFSKLDPAWKLVPVQYEGAAAIYVFEELNPSLWVDLQAARKRGSVVLWEIHGHVCSSELLPQVVDQLSGVDILSINRAELAALTGVDSIEEGLAVLSPHVPAIALRLGADGAVVHTPDAVLAAQPVPTVVVDPTGGGNSFSGAFVTAWVQAGDQNTQADSTSAGLERQAEAALRAAMSAAAITISGQGPPVVDDATLSQMKTLSDQLQVQVLDPTNNTEWKNT